MTALCINHLIYRCMKLLLPILLLITTASYAQKDKCASKEFTIEGDIQSNITVSMKTLDSFAVVTNADLTITNHKGEVKRTLTDLKGILLKDILQKVTINSDSPKTLSEFYLVFTACDGYRVVYSWNEIFNTPVGNAVYVIKEKGGENISSITTTDVRTGRRYVQGLSTVTIKRVQ